MILDGNSGGEKLKKYRGARSVKYEFDPTMRFR